MVLRTEIGRVEPLLDVPREPVQRPPVHPLDQPAPTGHNDSVCAGDFPRTTLGMGSQDNNWPTDLQRARKAVTGVELPDRSLLLLIARSPSRLGAVLKPRAASGRVWAQDATQPYFGSPVSLMLPAALG